MPRHNEIRNSLVSSSAANLSSWTRTAPCKWGVRPNEGTILTGGRSSEEDRELRRSGRPTFQREVEGVTWSLSGSYQATTTNSLEYRFGNQAILTAGVARAVNAKLSLSFQAKYFHQDRNEYLGQGVPCTGSEVVYLTPGFRVSPSRTVSFYGFVLLVPYQRVNERQLGPRIAVLTGLSKTF